MPTPDPDPFTMVDLCEICQALTWRDTLLHLEPSTLSVRVAHKIETYLEQEINA